MADRRSPDIHTAPCAPFSPGGRRWHGGAVTDEGAVGPWRTPRPTPADAGATAPPRGRRWAGTGRASSIVALLLVVLSLVGFAAATVAQDGSDRGVLANLISRALSTPATRVSIGAVEGALSSDATIRDIEISDRDGVWLKLDRARIVWRRLALLQRRLEIDRLEIGTIDIARRPIPAEAAVAGEDAPLLPELPVKVEIKDFLLQTLALGEPILGTPARIAMNGAAKLGNPQEGLDLRFDARRLDAGGTVAARLSLVPQGERLTLSLVVDEPAGGLLARAASIPGLPPVKLDLGGEGTLDAFAARLAFDGGPEIGATGTTTVNRQGTARRIALDLQARIAGLLPELAAPIFAGTTRLTGDALYADDGAIAIPGIALVASAARLDVAGGLTAAKVADLRVTAANLPNADGRRTALSGTEIGRLAFDARITDRIEAPRVVATLAVEDARTARGRLDRLDASFTSDPAPPTPGGRSRLQIAANLRATGLVPEDAALARAIGPTVTADLKGLATTDGVLEADLAEIRTTTVSARYVGRLASNELRGRLEASAGDLSRFAGLAGVALAGTATVAADVEGTPRANRYNAVLDAKLARFATGIAQVDGLFGGQAALAGTARLAPDGSVRFEEMRLTSGNATARIDGVAAQTPTSNLTVAVTIPDLRKVDGRVSGRGTLTGQLTGSVQSPDAALRLAVENATAIGRPVPRLIADIVGRDLVRAPDVRLTLNGEIDRKPARGTLGIARAADGTIRADGIDLQVGSVSLKGGVTLDPAFLATGRIMIQAGNLDDLSALALQKLSGTLDADVTLATPAGGQDARIVAKGERIAGFGAVVDRLDANLTLADIRRRPRIAGSVAIDEARIAGETISRVRLDATGTDGASDVVLTAAARGFALDARARIVPGDRTRIEILQFGATRDGRRIALAGPATVTLADGGAELRNVAIALGSGRLSVEGKVGSALDLRVEARAVPLSAADVVVPGLGLAGTFEGSASIAGTPSRPTGEYRASVRGLAAPQTRSLGLPPTDITASGRLTGERATIDATVVAGRAGQVRIGGSVPTDGTGALDVTVRGGIDAGVATTGLLAAAGRRLTGRVEIDARVAGTLAAPRASGTATLSGGTFTDAIQGTQFGNLQARIVARGDEVVIEQASATARNGGTVTASGRVRLDPGAGFPGEIRLAGQRAELTRSALATTVANLQIALSGPLARDPRVTGRIDIVTLDVTVPENLGATLGPLPNTRHLNPTRTARARLAQNAAAKGRNGRAAPAFNASLDLTLNAPGRIYVRGRGLNAELGGSIRVTGTLAQPAINGGFDLRSGTFQVISSRLDFTRGRLTFSGDLTPELDFVASTNAGGAAIEIAVTGPAASPNFEFRSSPDLPRDEILSRLLFNSPSGQLTTGQALALAQAAAQFSGGGGGGAFEDLRRSLGLGSLDVSAGTGGLGVGANKAINDRLSIGATAGATGAGVGATLRITDEIKLKGEFSAPGGSSVGIAAEYEW